MDSTASENGTNAKQAFLRATAVWNVYQFQAAEMAQQRARQSKVRALVGTLRNNHAQITEELLAAAGQYLVPTGVDKLHAALLDDLRETEDFDALYLAQEAKAAAHAYTLLQEYAQHNDDDAMQAFCAKTLLCVTQMGEALALLRPTESRK